VSVADRHLREAGRALSRSGVGFTELQRRAVAAVCLIAACTAEEAEAAMLDAELGQISRGSRLWHSGEDELEYAVCKALVVISTWRYHSRPRLRLVLGGSTLAPPEEQRGGATGAPNFTPNGAG
jgi:hypothetical protein